MENQSRTLRKSSLINKKYEGELKDNENINNFEVELHIYCSF